MKIEVIGSGCNKCKALFELTKEVVKDLGVADSVEYSADIRKIVAMGLMSSPVLTIDDKPVLVGVLPDKEKLKSIISEHVACESSESKVLESDKSEECDSCKCGGNC